MIKHFYFSSLFRILKRIHSFRMGLLQTKGDLEKYLTVFTDFERLLVTKVKTYVFT